MDCLEVIKLRSTERPSGPLREFLASITKVRQPGVLKISIYRHAALETDFSVHIHWRTGRQDEKGSPLALRLIQALKEFGLIDRSLWIKEKYFEIARERRDSK
jgi:hypothetical protein